MKDKFLIILSIVLLLIAPTIILTQSTNIYISTNGKDANKCTQFSPCRTFNKVINLAKPGDTIHILKGVYNETATISKSGAPKDYLSIVGHNAILNGVVVSGDYVWVSKVEVVGSISHGILVSGRHIIIQDSSVHHSVTENGLGPFCNTEGNESGWGSGIKVERGAENIIIRNNKSYENCGEGIVATMGKNVIIDNNISRDNYSVNIYIDNSYFTTVSNNHIRCTGNGYLRDGRRAAGIASGEEYYLDWGAQRHDNNILNNTVDGCYEGIASWTSKIPEGKEINLLIKNNTVINGTYRSIAIGWNNQNVLIENNKIFAPVHVDDTRGVTVLNNTAIGATP